jgi:hypothetical protein
VTSGHSFNAGDPPRNRTADGLGVIFLQIVPSASERHHRDMPQLCSEISRIGRRDQHAGITHEQQFRLGRGRKRRERRA